MGKSMIALSFAITVGILYAIRQTLEYLSSYQKQRDPLTSVHYLENKKQPLDHLRPKDVRYIGQCYFPQSITASEGEECERAFLFEVIADGCGILVPWHRAYELRNKQDLTMREDRRSSGDPLEGKCYIENIREDTYRKVPGLMT